MSVDFTFGVSCVTSDTRHTSSGSSSIRSNRGDNCKAPPPPDQPPHCGSSCFENYLMNLSSIHGPPTGQRNCPLPQESIRYDTAVTEGEFGCNTDPKRTEVPWFLASPGTPIDTASSEGAIEPTSVLNPLDCSSPTYNPATWAMSLYSNGPGSPAVDNLVDDGSPFLEKPEENDQGDLHNFQLEEGKAVLEYEDFVLYKEPDWFDDLEPQLFERPFATPQPRNDDERMSDDEYICYCGYCWPFSVDDDAGEQASLYHSGVDGNDVASAA
ncbi:uncharacterized protein FPRO_14868 [Fusarium proliferatum ET1]|uniref:Uncharacterized protein n=1 Tax=Fusarium proliferatum (strain ET1) TaxID=1227346 RepID=A0A1L7WAK4_FUSPR|nr:uncharacterized protein FPRO_14868 [Fusarium proliferatum ET1]CZR49653.1 uncharacterized protein FPRO_14868 [Fusarium proliferatum ET1]